MFRRKKKVWILKTRELTTLKTDDSIDYVPPIKFYSQHAIKIKKKNPPQKCTDSIMTPLLFAFDIISVSYQIATSSKPMIHYESPLPNRTFHLEFNQSVHFHRIFHR